MISFNEILKKYRNYSFSERDKGLRFEKLMQAFLKTYPIYRDFTDVYLWNEFPYKDQFGGHDIGIDLVAKTRDGEYWAIQCKCYQENSYIDKSELDSFLSTSSKYFLDENSNKINFAYRLWISTTNNWSTNAEQAIKNQNIPVCTLSLYDLENAEVDWEQLEKGIYGTRAELKKKVPRKHQIEAMESAHKYFQSADRGKLIMACGTGKTFTSLKIAENETNNDGLVLFLVPSIALIGQTLREWSSQSAKPINAICICSDSEVSKQKIEDDEDFSITDLARPASTSVANTIREFERIRNNKKFDKHNSIDNGMTVVFSTYQSIDTISKAQNVLNSKYNNEYIFDLIICDEAHRTTGVILKDKKESEFTKVHNNNFIASKKRLYMTATPRLYSDDIKIKAKEDEKIDVLCSMDDKEIYGEEIYRIGFGKAVDEGLLADYKVLVLTINEDVVPREVQKEIAKQNEDIELERDKIKDDDIARLIGCINALSKNLLHDKNFVKDLDPAPMKKAVAFCQNIRISKKIKGIFDSLQKSYYNLLNKEERAKTILVEAQHIDGSMGATKREEKLSWLRTEASENICKVLTNVRCLSEGVDVPTLDAALFLSSKNSQVEVVQSVGRVMRTAPNKKYGYIIIPVVIPYGQKPEDYLNKGEAFKVVWQVLNALRSHDDRFDAFVYSLSLKNENGNLGKDERIIVDNLSSDEEGKIKNSKEIDDEKMLKQLEFNFGDYQGKLYAMLVKKVGDKKYLDIWAKEVSDIAKANISRINDIIEKNQKARNEFIKFLEKLHKEINPSISEKETVEMLAQHIITQPIFEALFENYSFAKNNPVSKSMQKMIELLEEETPKEESEKLNRFYEHIKRKIKDLKTAEEKQSVIKELYGSFFNIAFKDITDKLGIVYTPIEVVDFIINSVNDVLKKEFNKTLTNKDVNIIDPFTGTGTFITRLLQSGLIKNEDLQRKYKKELFANEIVLLAYYIASINIENVYHSLMPETNKYETFDGICLTDTFQLYEDTVNENTINSSGNLLVGVENADNLILENSERIKRQKKSPIKIIISNPPYSKGQKSANDNNQNQHYLELDKKIADTYVKYSKASNKNSIYDSYIKAFRWASDRIDEKSGGIVGFITNSGWIDSNSADGFRQCLENEFSSIYIFDLKGGIRGKSGESAKKEGQNIFDIMAGVAIAILVKKPNNIEKAKIHYYNVGDYLKRKEKLEILKTLKTVLNKDIEWQEIMPNKDNDWINQRSGLFDSFIQIEPNKKYNKDTKSFFINYSAGINTARDAWVYNFSKKELEKNINATIEYYNQQRTEVKENKKELIKDPQKGNWADNLVSFLTRNIEIKENKNSYYKSIYRPFCKENVYFNEYLIERKYQMPSMFPYKNSENLCICISGLSSSKDFCCLITNTVIDRHFNGDSQCFPLYYYEEIDSKQMSLLDDETQYKRHDAISDFILKRAMENYGKEVNKEDIFYYVYGLLHSPIYREKFQADLKKMLPRIPLVDEPKDFWAFSKAGRDLAELHLNYENIPANKNCEVIGRESNNFIVDKMQFAKNNNKEKDKTTIIYNSNIKIKNIPERAYQYIINGKSAVEWIMDRYQITINKDNNIKNDPNDWAAEHNKPSYILDLLLSVIELSIRTLDIIDNLPRLNFE